MNAKPRTLELLRHLAQRPGHDEVKADFRHLLLEEFGASLHDLEFERRVPEVRGRLDALVGRTILEAKSNLDREIGDVLRRMPDYLADREREEGEKYIGIATDGLKWSAYRLVEGTLERATGDIVLDPEKSGLFLAWLDGVVALKSSLPPDPQTIRIELGNNSVAFNSAFAELRTLWNAAGEVPAVALKRQLWASLLKLVHGKDIEGDVLWLQHTYLVIVAKSIAVAVLGLKEDDPSKLLSGDAFRSANIFGAVESDFFDWIVSRPEGERLVRRIMAHIRRFRLAEVDSDVLKILYESLIDRDERHGLGEYYTPDWLAAKVVKHVVQRPLEQKVLDPACGSGTFLFHAVRHALAEAEEAGLPVQQRAQKICEIVAGMDIHPVAVIIARVTYLLALAPVLGNRAGPVSVPVYLGDALQLSISELLTGKELKITVPPPPAGAANAASHRGETLDFPDTFCRDPGLFDKAIERMRSGSLQDMTRAQIELALVQITEQHYKRDINREEKLAIQDLGKTYETFDRLRKEGRDTVWAYVARNLSRPLALSAAGGWANVLVGNPPWVAYRHMSKDLQKRFREIASGERVFVGGKLATQNDLCALFMVRAAGLYLHPAGKLGFVLPLAVLTRGQFEKLRAGSFHSTHLAYDELWMMDDDLQPLFPVPASVVFARKRAVAKPMPDIVARRWSGMLPVRDAHEAVADARLKLVENVPKPAGAVLVGGSPYRKMFRQGATLVPRMLCLVERQTLGRLGADQSAPFVASRRNSLEKKPWKDLDGVKGTVEAQFLKPILLGESIVPFGILRSYEGVVPLLDDGSVLDSHAALTRGYTHLEQYMRDAEAIWDKHRPTVDLDLVDQYNYYGKLSAQRPISGFVIVYTKAGKNLTATAIHNSKFIYDHKLYWASFSSLEETMYLVATLNSEVTRDRVEHMQSRGQWGARDFDKVAFNLAIPRFDPANELHRALVAAAEEAERLVSSIVFDEAVPFTRARRQVRDALAEAGLSERMDALVERLLDGT